MYQYVYLGKKKTIHSSCQIKYYNNTVDDKSPKVGGKQYIMTGWLYYPTQYLQWLAYVDMSKPTDVDFSSLLQLS